MGHRTWEDFLAERVGSTGQAALHAVQSVDLSALNGDEGVSVWETWLLASRLSLLIEQAIATAEPAYLARYAFQLAQQFNNFYHKHHILTEADEAKKRFLLTTAAIVRRALMQSLELMGIGAPSVM